MDIVSIIKNSASLYFNKEGAFDYIDKNVKLFEIFLMIVVVSVLNFIVDLFVKQEIFSKTEIFLHVITTLVVFSGAFLLFYSFLHLLFRIFGGKAAFKDTVRFGLSVSIFPSVVLLGFSLISLLFIGNEILSLILSGVLGVASLVLFIWSFIITALVYTKVHKISVLRAVLVLLLNLFFFLFIGFLYLFFLVMGMY